MAEACTLAVGGDSEVLSARAAVLGLDTKTTLGHGLPDLALVGTTSEGLVGVKDGITGLGHGGGARLEREGVGDKLHGQVLAIGGNTLGVEGREVSIGVAVLVNEVPEVFVEDGSPDGTNGVDLVLGVGGAVGHGVGLHVGRVGVLADTLGVVVDPVSERNIGGAAVRLVGVDSDGHEVRPAFTHTTGLEGVEAVGVGGTTSQTGGQTVGVLVENDTGVEGAVTVGGRLSPEVHAHASVLAIRGSGKVGVVGARAVLGVQDDHVVATAALVVVVGLEVTSSLGETESVQQVVVLVGSVEELGDGSVQVGLGLGVGSGGPSVLKLAIRSAGAVVVEVAVATAGVVLGNTVVTASHGVVLLAIAEPGEGRGSLVPGVGNNNLATLRRVVDIPREYLHGDVGNVVDNTVDVLVVLGINIGQQPVVTDIGLNSPGESKRVVSLAEVDKTSFGVRDSTRGGLEAVVLLGSILGLSGGRTGLNGEAEDVDGALESGNGVGESARDKRALLGDLSGEKVVTEREDLAILDVDLEVGIVNVNAVDGLLQVDVSNTAGADEVVLDNAELSTRDRLLDELLGSRDVVATLLNSHGDLVALGSLRGGVAGHIRHAEARQVNATLAELSIVSAGRRVRGSKAGKTKKSK